MATDIYFVTDLQNAQQLTELLNDPGSILNFNPCNADIKEKRKSIFSKKKKKNWPVSVEALRKVVLYSKQRKAHYEIAQVGQGQWQIMETPIEEVYVRNLRTLRVVPWLQKLFMPGKKKKNNKPLFPPPRWSLKPSKHKSQNKAQPQLPPAKPAAAPEPEPAPQPEQQQQQQQQREEEEELRQEPPVPAQHQERRNSAGVAGAYDADAGGARVNVVGSANDLFGDNGELRSAAEIGAAARPLLTVQEDHREAFPEGPPLQPRRFSAYRSAYGPAGPANNGGPGGAYSTWPPPKQRSRGNHLAACAAIQAERAAAAQAAEAAEAAEAAAEGGGGAKQQQPGRTASLTMTPTSRLSNMHEVTLRDIVGVDDDVLAWEAQRKGAAGDQAAKLNAAREDLEERVRRQQEEQVAHAANRRAERAEAARVEAEFQAALRLEQKRLQNAARASLQRQARARSNSAKRHPHSKPAPAPPGAADAVADDDFSGASARVVYPTSIVRCGGGGGAAKAAEAAAPAVVYPTTIVRRGSAAQVHDEEEQRRQQRECCDSDDGSSSSDGDQPDAPVPASAYLAREAAAMQEREDMRRAMRSQPGWGGKVQELAEFGGVSTVSAEAVLENFHGNLKAGKLYFLERMSFA